MPHEVKLGAEIIIKFEDNNCLILNRGVVTETAN